MTANPPTTPGRLRLLRSALAFALLLCGVLFVHNPIMLYAENAGELQFNLLQICSRLLLFFGAGLVLCLLPAAFLPRRLVRGWVSLSGGLAFFAWLHSRFIVQDFGLLDGTTLDLSTTVLEAALHLLLLSGVLALVYLLHRRFEEPVEGFAWMLTLVLTASSAWTLWHDEKPAVPLELEREALQSLYRFSSTQKNVFIVLMDAFQSDTFSQAVDEDPSLKARLDGFVFYKNAMGVARTTRMSMPAIYAGLGFADGEALGDWSRRSRRESFITQLSRRGFEVWMTNPVGSDWGRRVKVSPSSLSILSHPRFERMSEAALLVDLSLFRSLPLPLKPYVYNDERWLFKKYFSQDWLASRSTQDNRMMEVFAEKMSAAEAKPTLKFFRLVNTHSPTDVGEDCGYRLSPLTRESYMWQVRCAMSRFGELMDRLRELGVYDDTMVLLIADHGRQLPNTLADELSIADDHWAKLSGVASPVFAVKPFSSRGPMHTSDAPVQLTDVGATVCSGVPGCRQTRGRSVFDIEEGESRPRKFITYNWKRENWKKDHLSDVRTFWIDGPVYRIESWRRELGPDDRMELRALDFSKSRDIEYFGFGWGGYDKEGNKREGRWSLSLGSTIYMDLPETGDIEVMVRVRAAADWHEQEMALLVNGGWVGVHAVPSRGWERLSYRIPEEVRVPGVDTLTFTFPSANDGVPRRAEAVLFRRLRVGGKGTKTVQPS